MKNKILITIITACFFIQIIPICASIKNTSPFFYSYEKGKREIVNVYVKVKGKDNRYAKFRIVHEVFSPHNKNLWRIMESHFSDFDGKEMHDGERLLVGAENELAWFSARLGVKDATGGFHGNEHIDLEDGCGVKFFADNKEVDFTQNVGLTPCSSLHYIQISTMHQTGTGGLNGKPGYVEVEGNPIECYHEKKTTFGNGGFSVNNKLFWDDNNAQVGKCTYALFCIDNKLTTKATNAKGESAVFCTDNGSKLKSENQKITYLNEETGLKIICDGKIKKCPSHRPRTFIWDNANYHKYYSHAEFDSARPKKGEVWEMESSISFSY